MTLKIIGTTAIPVMVFFCIHLYCQSTKAPPKNRYELAVVVGWVLVMIPAFQGWTGNRELQVLNDVFGIACWASAAGLSVTAMRIGFPRKLGAILLAVAAAGLIAAFLWFDILPNDRQ